MEEQLANFNPETNTCVIDSDTLNFLVMKEYEYSPDPFYLDKK
jgi:hypothetical protein